jgi:hypothetical protein
MKYSFYGQKEELPELSSDLFEHPSQQNLIQNGMVMKESPDEKPKDKARDDLVETHSPKFVITFCAIIIVFYLVAVFIAFYAYREFKGIAEDCAGGSVNYLDGNVLYYGIIDNRDDMKSKRESIS